MYCCCLGLARRGRCGCLFVFAHTHPSSHPHTHQHCCQQQVTTAPTASTSCARHCRARMVGRAATRRRATRAAVRTGSRDQRVQRRSATAAHRPPRASLRTAQPRPRCCHVWFHPLTLACPRCAATRARAPLPSPGFPTILARVSE